MLNPAVWARSDTMQRPHESGVYFAAESTGRYIKIGWSYRPGKRIGALRIEAARRFGSLDVDYLAIIPGNETLERTLHRHFSCFRHEGEWFRAEAELLEFLEPLKQTTLPVSYFYGRHREKSQH